MAKADHLKWAQEFVDRALSLGAEQADALVSVGLSLGASCRLGQTEDIERAEETDIGLRAMLGNKQAFVSGSGLNRDNIDKMAQRVVDMAQMAPEDPFCGLAEVQFLADTIPDLDLNDPQEPSTQALRDKALETEAVARGFDGITNSEGAGAGWSRNTTCLVTSHGFAASQTASSWSLSCAVVAGADDKMERDYATHSTRHLEDLDTPKAIGTLAAQRTLQRLNPRKIESTKAPVIYDPRVADSLLGHFSAAISGAAIARGTSFLHDKMREQIFPDNVSIIDDPLRPRGLRSAAFDGEGVRGKKLALVENGTLHHWLLESATAKQLGLQTNGRAGRGIGSPPAPASSNLYMAAGEKTPEELMRAIGTGFYVTELIGMGVNGVTGDYSRGAAGFWIENGQLGEAVSGITLAGNLKDMFAALTPANDLTFRRGINAPSLLIEEMSIAGL